MDALNAQLALGEVLEHSAKVIRETPPEQWTEGLLLSRLELLERYWADFAANHVELLSDRGLADAPYFMENKYYQIEGVYASAKGCLYDLRARHDSPPSETRPDSPTTRSVARLPKITLPVFDGRRENWESFRDLFRSLIHEDASLPDVDKLYYLKSSVTGDAKAALDSLKVTGPNYHIAWSTLESRFDHQRLLAQEHIKALKLMRPMKEESASELQALLDGLERHRDQLKSLERPVESWDDWFISIAADTMDQTTRRDWEEELETSDQSPGGDGKYHPTFNTLAEFLRRRCRTLSSLGVSKSSKIATSASRGTAVPALRGSRTVAATATSDYRCVSCNEPHYTGRCASYKSLSPKDRHRLVVQHRLCFNCLREGHAARDCPSPMTCQTCGAQHHTSIHDASGKRAASTPGGGAPAKQTRMDDDGTASSTDVQSPQ